MLIATYLHQLAAARIAMRTERVWSVDDRGCHGFPADPNPEGAFLT
jgi:hypothetical protein